jgi:methylphosphotriester-DNA--protein-cysteine methyltransferase
VRGYCRTADLATLAESSAADGPRRETAPWSLATLHRVTHRFAAGAGVAGVADEIGWAARTMQRQCDAVYGYGPATLRRILRVRAAVALLRSGRSTAEAAATAGCADRPHLHRDVREFAGTSVGALMSG